MRRRAVIAVAGGASLAWPLTVRAQAPGSLRRIGILSPQSVSSAAPLVDALRKGLQDQGWRESENIAYEVRYADGTFDILPALARELVGRNVEVIVAGSNPGVHAARRASATLPIVMVTTGDPVAGGLVASLARPGGNVTGVTTVAQDLSGKRLELLREVLPGIRRVALLINPDSPYTPIFTRDVVAAAAASGVELQVLEARDTARLEAAFAAMRAGNASALLVVSDIMFITQRSLIARLAIANRLPAIYWERAFVDAGGLMFYGAALAAMYRRAATHVDKILKGARPAELPVEQPTDFDFVINLATAKTMGLTIPPAILARADEVIE